MKLDLSRDQLASFLKDYDQIKQFEQLFKVVQAIAPNVVEEVRIEAGSATASAESAHALITVLSQVLGVLAVAPVAENNNSIVTDYIDLRRAAPHISRIRRLAWNDTDQTADIGMEYDVVQQVGLEHFARVGNTTGSAIPKGTVAGFAGATSDALLVEPYLADGSMPSLYILGVMAHELPDSGEKGYCTAWGFVRDIDTSAFAAGDVLYADPTTPGALTNTKPTAPDNVIPVAACIVSDPLEGVIFVRPTIEQQKYYGEFTKTTNQTPAATNTEYLLTIDNAEIENGVTIGTPSSRIVVPESGLYKIDATLQITSNNNSSKNVWVWLKKNGATVSNSARIVSIEINNGYVPVTLMEVISLAANDYIELAFAASNTGITISTVAATAFAPAAPAVVLSVTQIQQ